MTTPSSQKQPTSTEFDRMISVAHQNMCPHLARGHQGPTGLRLFLAGVVTLAVTGGGVAVANVGPFSDVGAENHTNVKEPVGVDGNPAAGPGENAVTTTPWPKNEFGLTYGEPTRADVLAHNLPDLMPVTNQDGVSGYWRSVEVYKYTSGGGVENMPAAPHVYTRDGVTRASK